MDKCIRRRIGKRDRLRNALVALVRYGSYERSDFVPGRSDLDYFGVVDSEVADTAETVRDIVVNPLSGILSECAESIDHRGVDIAWEYRQNLSDPDRGVRFKFLTVYQEDFRRHHTLVYGEDIMQALPSIDCARELPSRLDRIERLVAEQDDAAALRMLAGETARLRAVVDDTESLRKDDVRATLVANGRTDALRVYDAYLQGASDELSPTECESFVQETIAALRREEPSDPG